MTTLKLVERKPHVQLLDFMQRHQLSLPGDYMRRALQLVVQWLMEIEVSALIDASRYERNHARRAYRNGYRDSVWQTQFGDLPIRIPKLRSGTYYPDFIEHPAHEVHLSHLVLAAYLFGLIIRQAEDLLADFDIEIKSWQIAELQAALYDLIQSCTINIQDYTQLVFEQLPVDRRNKRQILALIIGIAEDGEGEILAHDITPDADHRSKRLNTASSIAFSLVKILNPPELNQ